MFQVVSNFVDGYSSKLKSFFARAGQSLMHKIFKICIIVDLGEGGLGIPMIFCRVPTCTCTKTRHACVSFSNSIIVRTSLVFHFLELSQFLVEYRIAIIIVVPLLQTSVLF